MKTEKEIRERIEKWEWEQNSNYMNDIKKGYNARITELKWVLEG